MPQRRYFCVCAVEDICVFISMTHIKCLSDQTKYTLHSDFALLLLWVLSIGSGVEKSLVALGHRAAIATIINNTAVSGSINLRAL